nr:primosomal protein N' [Desulfocapsaceae bacterium]
HHFPYVTFVGVVWADGGLNMPDFRAAERTYQLLSQVTGRAGRDELQGRVIIQTMLPDHYAIALATQHDYTAFYQQEISLRKKPAFPPFIRLACLRISGQNEFNVRKTSTNIAISCRKLQENEDFYLNVLGPAPSPLGKIKDKYRWQILFKADRVATLHSVWKHVMENSKQLVLGRSECRFDLDPENMM